MLSLFDEIKHLQASQWDYYHFHSKRSLKFPEFNGNKQSAKFIKSYFKRGGKEKLLKSYFRMTDTLLSRSGHTVSIFFMGILIYSHTKIKEYMDWGENPPEYEVFPLLWFLTCLFHDFGYEYEINRKYFSQIADITSLKKYFRIRHHLLDQNISYLPKDLIRSIPIYFQYKIASRMEIDHGIVAGLYLYDKLVKNRLLKKGRRQRNNDDLLWDDCLDEQYALAGGTIATHNIWFSDTKSKSSYIKYGLTDLINRHPITLAEAPLLFLLGLVDTIDPVKLFGSKHKKDSEILESILIDCYKNEIRLSIDSRARLSFNKLRKRCKKLELWLAVKVFDRDSCIYIRF